MATQTTTHLATIVGANISEARKREGLTQQEVATALGTSISRVSSWERGYSIPSPPKRPTLAALLFGGDETAMYREAEEAAA